MNNSNFDHIKKNFDLSFFADNLEKINSTTPMNPRYHKKMLQQLQGYHQTAKQNQHFSLVNSLEIFSKFVITDFWLNTVVNEEIKFLKLNNLSNPYHKT